LLSPSLIPEWQEVGVDFGGAIPGVPDTGFSSGFTEFAPKIIDALLRGETVVENAATFEDGWEIQKVLDAARGSNATGCRTDC
jgi:predicted dehydrogenase